MTEIPSGQDSRVPHRPLLWSLLFGNFVTGTGILLPAGMLNDLAAGLNISIPEAGQIMLVGGLAVAVSAPLVAALTSRIDRRPVLVASMVLYALAHLASALAPNLDVLLAVRIAVGVGAAMFTPQAAATVGTLLPPERRAAAITMIFVGWSLSTVAGVTLGGYLAHALGWQTVYLIVAALSVLAAVLVWMTVPGGVKIAPLNSKSWGDVFKNPALMLVLLVTVINGAAQFTLYTYLAPSLRASLDASPALVTGVLAWFGIWAATGTAIANKLVAAYGAPLTAHAMLLTVAAGLLTWATGANSLPLVLLAAAIWGLGNFAVQSVQQARLAGLAPNLTSASISLNTSAIFVGQSMGSALGGLLIKNGKMGTLPYAGAIIMLTAFAVSLFAARQRTS